MSKRWKKSGREKQPMSPNQPPGAAPGSMTTIPSPEDGASPPVPPTTTQVTPPPTAPAATTPNSAPPVTPPGVAAPAPTQPATDLTTAQIIDLLRHHSLWGWLWTLLVVICTSVAWGAAIYYGLQHIDEKIEKRVEETTSTALKEMLAKSESSANENELMRAGIECEHEMVTENCQGNYANTVGIYEDFNRQFPMEKVPVAIKPGIYEQYTLALYKSGKFHDLRAEEIEQVTKVLEGRKETCGATYYYLVLLR